MKRCSLCETIVMGDSCPNCGMRIETEEKKTSSTNNTNYYGNVNDSKSFNNYNDFNNEYQKQEEKGAFKTKKIASTNKSPLLSKILSVVAFALFINAGDIMDLMFPEPEPEPEINYSQIIENFESNQEQESNQAQLEENLQGILDGIELPDIEGLPTDESLQESSYWQSEYDFISELSSNPTFNVSYYPGIHIVGLDIPAGDYKLTVDNSDTSGMPTNIMVNGESLEIKNDIFLSFNEGDIFQYVGGNGFTLFSTNHQDLIFLDAVSKNEEYMYMEVESEVEVGEAIQANTYDIKNLNLFDISINVDYPDGYAISDFTVTLTNEDYYFDNLILPYGTKISSDASFMLEISPFNVDSIIS